LEDSGQVAAGRNRWRSEGIDTAIQGDDPETVLMRGGSAIVNPLGRVLTGPDYSGEKILTADLDPGEIAEGKFDLDVVGHYARPDVFRLEVNEKSWFLDGVCLVAQVKFTEWTLILFGLGNTIG
jgi:hypothetical protein